jgi:hypothetical protein
MKTIIAFVFLLSLKYSAFAQTEFTLNDDLTYAVIKDTDGFVNIRKAPNSSSPIVGKIYKNNIFSCETNKTNWWKVLQIRYDDHHKSNWLEGYIYNDRVLLLSTWKKISRKNVYPDSCVLKNDSLIVSVRKTSFNPGKHKLLKKSHELLLIDGKGFWGTDGEIPKESIFKLKIIKNGKSIIIPNDSYNDLYEPHLETLSISYGPKNAIYLSMSNSDGAGGYTIIWVFKDNKYYTRYIDDSEE